MLCDSLMHIYILCFVTDLFSFGEITGYAQDLSGTHYKHCLRVQNVYIELYSHVHEYFQ